jgi:mannan endo-1,4-beta-mannosidase
MRTATVRIAYVGAAVAVLLPAAGAFANSSRGKGWRTPTTTTTTVAGGSSATATVAPTTTVNSTTTTGAPATTLAPTTTTTATTAPTSTTTPVPNTSVTANGFVQRSGGGLVLDGKTFRFDGTNIYDVNSNGNCVPATDLNADLNALPGQEVFRAYFFQNWATKNGVRDWTRMDATVATAAAHGEKIIAVLANEWNYCDGPTKYLPWWQSGYATTVNPGDLTSYRKWVAEIVARYANNPAIGLWQLVNEGEARNADGSCSETTAMTAMRSFADDVGGLIHTLDPNHLVSVGPVSGECGTNEADYQTVYASPGADVCDYHDYGFPTSPGGNTDPWNGLGVSISRCHAIGRPIIVGEMGIHTTTTLTDRATEFSAKFSWQFANGVSGSLMWDYSPTPQAPPSYEIGPTDPSAALLRQF